MAVKSRHDHSNSYNGQHLIRADLLHRDLVCHHREEKHVSVQVGIVLEKELTVSGSVGNRKLSVSTLGIA